LNYETLIKNQI